VSRAISGDSELACVFASSMNAAYLEDMRGSAPHAVTIRTLAKDSLATDVAFDSA
jgi:hypothetical protein